MYQHADNTGWKIELKEGKHNCAAIKNLGGKCNDMSSMRVEIKASAVTVVASCDTAFAMHWDRTQQKAVHNCDPLSTETFFYNLNPADKTKQGCVKACVDVKDQNGKSVGMTKNAMGNGC